jgi:acyl-[acyl-carrier-protein]-phospholipid O-acyltransferase/long-chain-fatty-acid--[acyl-carrier-protein] ligase
VTELLNKGKVVCLFPEGALSRTGHLGTFRHGYEKACENVSDDVVIQPFYLRGLWGSQWSRSSDWVKKTRASGLQRDLIVAFGKSLPKDTQADVLKRKVFDLSIESWQEYINELPTLGDAWISSVKQNKPNFAIAEATGTPLSSKKLFVATAAFAKRIRNLSSEQNVGLLLPTSTGGVIANMASLLAGKTVVNLNYSASVDAMHSAIERAEIKTIFTSQLFLGKLKQRGIDFSSCFTDTRLVMLEDLKKEITKAELSKHAIAIHILPGFILKALYCREHDPEATAAILFSSGSEGKPKGVMLSHRNIMANVKQISDVLNTEQSDVVMASLPLFHAFGLTVTQFLPLIEGLPMVCHPDPTDALGISKSVARYRGTIMFGTSTFLRLFIRNSKVHPLMLESLRLVVAGAEKLRGDVREQFKLKFNKEIYEGYGATETTPVASVNLPDALDINHWHIQAGGKLGTVGMALPGSSFKIVDPESWEELPTGSEGMILIGGSQVMKGYLNDVDKTEDAIRHIDNSRWYVTGDKGRLDEDGFLTIVDRYSRFAKIGGEMVSLGRVEELIRSCIEDDELDLVAISIPDPKKGERIVLLADRDLAQDHITQKLLSQGNSSLILPSEWHRVDEVPKLGSGKTDFSRAKALALELAA